MLTLTKCEVFEVSDPDTVVEDAVVVASGDSPGAVVRISRRDDTQRKYVQFDRVLEASITGHGRDWRVEGRSEHLENVIGVSRDDSIVTYKITTRGVCQGCR